MTAWSVDILWDSQLPVILECKSRANCPLGINNKWCLFASKITPLIRGEDYG